MWKIYLGNILAIGTRNVEMVTTIGLSIGAVRLVRSHGVSPHSLSQGVENHQSTNKQVNQGMLRQFSV